jgi:hypothetical protein
MCPHIEKFVVKKEFEVNVSQTYSTNKETEGNMSEYSWCFSQDSNKSISKKLIKSVTFVPVHFISNILTIRHTAIMLLVSDTNIRSAPLNINHIDLKEQYYEFINLWQV